MIKILSQTNKFVSNVPRDWFKGNFVLRAAKKRKIVDVAAYCEE